MGNEKHILLRSFVHGLGKAYIAYRRLHPFQSLPFDRLNLGSAITTVPGWYNLDYTDHILVDRVPLLRGLLHRLGKLDNTQYEWHSKGLFREVHYWDLAIPLPFLSNSFSFAYSSHVLEHLYLLDVRRFLAELFRVLKPGGLVRIVIPDLLIIAKEYVRVSEGLKDDSLLFLGEDISASGGADMFLSFFYGVAVGDATHQKLFGHRWMYDFESLQHYMTEAGFIGIHRLCFREGACPDLDVLDTRPRESLHVEAIKPTS